jgi:hypothetical protein
MSKRAHTVTRSPPRWLERNMYISIECQHQDFRPSIANYFYKNGYISHISDLRRNETKKVGIKYNSDLIGRHFRGALMCQLIGRPEFPHDVFILVGWKAPPFRPTQFYAVLLETRRGRIHWEGWLVGKQYELFSNRLKTYHDGHMCELWLLRNGTKLRLMIDVIDDGNYRLTVCEDKSDDRNCEFSVWL